MLEDELARGDYQLTESLVSRIWRWFSGLFDGLSLPGQLPPWATWVVLGAVLLAVVAVLAFAARDRWRTGRLTEHRPTGAVLEGPRRSAAAHRADARRALEAGDHDTAVLEGYRSLAAGAIERTLLEDRPGSTAHEVGTGLAPVFPAEAPALLRAADHFDAVRYGDHRADADQARHVLGVDERLAAARPELAEGGVPR